MNIGLIDVDGHHFPNLALMRISAYHKSKGDNVEWWWGFNHYDIVYMSKVFSDTYSPDIPEPTNADLVIKGGTGYEIKTVDGKEVYTHTHTLADEIERMFPDYSIYPQYDFAVAMTSRGCPRGCGFCHVAAKEGRRSIKVADVSDFWNGQKEIQVLDPNITACKEKRDLFRQYKETGAKIEFNQGLDIRLINEDDIKDLNDIKLTSLHFAWDNPEENLLPRFQEFSNKFKHSIRRMTQVYILTNYQDCTTEEHIERALARIMPLRELNYNPYLMIYNKPDAPIELKRLQRWCNNKFIFWSTPTFDEYRP